MFTYLLRHANKIWFVALHFAVLTVFLVPATWDVVLLGVGMYYIRMFGLTAGYHRLLSHRAFACPRWFQFVLAWIGCACLQRGPIW